MHGAADYSGRVRLRHNGLTQGESARPPVPLQLLSRRVIQATGTALYRDSTGSNKRVNPGDRFSLKKATSA